MVLSSPVPDMRTLGRIFKVFYGDDAKSIDNALRYVAGQLPFVGDLARLYDSNRARADYMSNRKIDWSKVKYPTMLPSGSIGGVLSGSRAFDSDMSSFDRLYDDYKPTPRIKFDRNGAMISGRYRNY